MPNPTPEQSERITAFLKEYGELVVKHKVDFINYPQYVPDGQGGWKLIVQTHPMDTSDQPVKSFIQP